MEKILELALNGEFGAITLDTEVFKHESLKLHAGRLALLRQFKNGSPRLVLTDIVVREVRKHLLQEVEKAFKSLEHGFADAKSVLLTTSEQIEASRKALRLSAPEETTESQFSAFKDGTNFYQLEVSDFDFNKELLERYFSIRPPFENNDKKKHEFPDAFSLLALEAYARECNTKILVVSRDKGWKLYCDESERLFLIEDLERAFSAISARSALAGQVARYVASDLLKEGPIFMEILSYLEGHADAIEVSLEASSNYEYEEDINEVTIEKMIFVPSDEFDQRLLVEDIGSEHVVVEVELQLGLKIKSYFNFFKYDSVDKESMSLGSGTAIAEESTSASVLVKFVGNVEDSVESLQLNEIELLHAGVHLQFGEIEPDWMQDDHEAEAEYERHLAEERLKGDRD